MHKTLFHNRHNKENWVEKLKKCFLFGCFQVNDRTSVRWKTAADVSLVPTNCRDTDELTPARRSSDVPSAEDDSSDPTTCPNTRWDTRRELKKRRERCNNNNNNHCNISSNNNNNKSSNSSHLRWEASNLPDFKHKIFKL